MAFLLLPLPVLILAVVLSGCGGSDSWNLTFEAKTQDAVQFDVVGINGNDIREWQDVTAEEYWTAGGSLRANAPRLTFQVVGNEIKFLESANMGSAAARNLAAGRTVTLPRTDAAWNEWLEKKKAIAVVVIGRFPSASDSKAQKQIVPLISKCWETKKSVLTVEIQDSRVYVATPPSPKAAKYRAQYGL